MELFPNLNTLNGVPLTDIELKMLAKHAHHVKVEPGDVVREHGVFDEAKDGYHIILKGQLQLQIPEPQARGTIESLKMPEIEEHELK